MTQPRQQHSDPQPDAAHSAQLENPSALLEALTAFWAANDEAGSQQGDTAGA